MIPEQVRQIVVDRYNERHKVMIRKVALETGVREDQVREIVMPVCASIERAVSELVERRR